MDYRQSRAADTQAKVAISAKTSDESLKTLSDVNVIGGIVVSLFDSVLNKNKKPPKPPSLEEERWISVWIGLTCPKELTGVTERKLRPYADDIGWGIHNSEYNEETDIIRIIFSNKDGQENTISPLEFYKVMKKVFAFSSSILKEFNIDVQEDGRWTLEYSAVGEAMIPPKLTMESRHELIVMRYDLSKRVRLEKENPELANAIFLGPSEPLIKDMCKQFNDKKNGAVYVKSLKEISKYGEIKSSPPNEMKQYRENKEHSVKP